MKYSSTQALIVIFFSIMLRFNAELQFLSYLMVAAYSLFGLRQVLLSMLLVWIFIMLNTSIAGPNTFSHIGRVLVLFCSMFSILIYYPAKRDFKISKLFLVTIIFGIFLIFHSIFFSVIPSLSLSKSIYWIASFLTIFFAWNSMNNKTFNEFSKFFYYLLVGILLINFSLINSPLGFVQNIDLFQGFFDHPNAFGIFCSILVSFSIGRLNTANKNSVIYFMIIILGFLLILFSGSRTAGFAVILSLIAAFIIMRFFTSRKLETAFSIKIFYILTTFLIISYAIFSILEVSLINNFINKGQNTSQTLDYNDYEMSIELSNSNSKSSNSSDSLKDYYMKSRGVIIVPMISNIKIRPLTGLGFGVSSTPSNMNIAKDPIFGIPLSAPIEKGFLPIAIIEELGIFGFLIFLYWILIIYQYALNNRQLLIPIFFTLILINAGEYVLFSPGGFGLFVLIFFGWICAASKHKNDLMTR